MALFGLLPDAPKPPDPTKTAQAQYQYNQKAAQDTMRMGAAAANRTGPFGSTTTQVDENGMPIGQTATLSGALQGSADNLTGNLGAQTGLLPTGAFDPNVDASGIRQAYMDNAMLAAQPEFARQDKLREIRLAERGIPLGSEIFTDVENQVGEQRNQFLRGAANDAFIAGTQEEQRQRGNKLQDYLLPFHTSQSTLGLLQGVGGLTPGFAPLPTASVGAPNYDQLVRDKYDADMAAYNNQMGGIGQLVGTGLGLLTAPVTGPMGLSNTLLGMGAKSIFG